jgi:hypothetical protein
MLRLLLQLLHGWLRQMQLQLEDAPWLLTGDGGAAAVD